MNTSITKIAEVIKVHIPDAKIILFGSRARGDELKNSDIDLIIVSRTFEGMHFTDRVSLILRILWKTKTLPSIDMDILCYTPEELRKKSKEISIVKEALRYGIQL